ncbi:hypothetical protein CPB86DRAFT_444162 [Serendipita vermifera]|nr:hypothetical protein CPB86DRAFT_444162 [Serendipita vermifera]
MPPTKKRKLNTETPSKSAISESDDDNQMSDIEESREKEQWPSESGESQSPNSAASSTDTEEEITRAQIKKRSKKTSKRKLRATSPSRFGDTLEALLSTTTPTAAPLALKPSIQRRITHKKNDIKKRKRLEGEKKDHEEIGRITDVIGGWGGENERSLRKVAQRGVVQLFNVIQKAQAAKSTEEKSKLALRGSGKPTLPAPRVNAKSKKSITSSHKEESVEKSVFLDAIRSGGVVSRV